MAEMGREISHEEHLDALEIVLLFIFVNSGNILITEDGTVKLGDFDVSLSYKERPGSLMGSETWGAPEVLKYWNQDRVWSSQNRRKHPNFSVLHTTPKSIGIAHLKDLFCYCSSGGSTRHRIAHRN